MKAKWLMLLYGYDHELNAIHAAIERSGREVKCLKYVPHDRDSVYPENDCVVLNGPIFLVMDAMKNRGWVPTAWMDMEVLSCRSYYSAWGDHLLQKDYLMLPLGEVRRRRDWLYELLGNDGTLFVRPDANSKRFDAEKIARENFEAWSQQLDRAMIEPSALCVVSRPRPIEIEWRMIMRRGKYVTGSSYRVEGEVDRTVPPTADVVRFSEKIAAIPFEGLPPVYVLDVCVTKGEFAVVEMGSVNVAGYYNCDHDAIIEAVSKEAEAEWAGVYAE
jgi:hypothetical protein